MADFLLKLVVAVNTQVKLLSTCLLVLKLCLIKVHGGTTEQVIVEKVHEAIKLAEHNRKKGFRHYTILFFDEANTTDAIGLIKEIMCDRRFHGKPIPENIKFIAACNPYRQ